MKPNLLQRAWQALDRFFHAPVPAARLGAFRALVCALACYDILLYAGLVLSDANAVSAGGAERPWTPIYLFQVLGLRPIGIDAAHLVEMVSLTALVLGAFGVASRWTCAIGAIGFLYWTGLAYSFGKPHHDKVALAFALAALPFAPVGAAVSIDSLWRRWRHRRRGSSELLVPPVSSLPIRLAQFTIAVGYCGAGSEKLLLGGATWFNGYTLQGIMLGHDGDWSRLFASSVWLAQLQSFGVVAVQALFPLVFFWPRSRWFFLPAATGFHLMTWKTMDTGPYMRLWLLLLAFVPLEQVPAALRRWLGGGGVRAVVVAVGVCAYVGLVGIVAAHVVPTWILLSILAVLSAGFAQHVRHHRGGIEPGRAAVHRVDKP